MAEAQLRAAEVRAGRETPAPGSALVLVQGGRGSFHTGTPENGRGGFPQRLASRPEGVKKVHVEPQERPWTGCGKLDEKWNSIGVENTPQQVVRNWWKNRGIAEENGPLPACAKVVEFLSTTRGFPAELRWKSTLGPEAGPAT